MAGRRIFALLVAAAQLRQRTRDRVQTAQSRAHQECVLGRQLERAPSNLLEFVARPVGGHEAA
jgi:ribosome modulation factor